MKYLKKFENVNEIKTYFVYHEPTGPNRHYYEIYKKLEERKDVIKMKMEYIYDIEEDDNVLELKKSSTEFYSYLTISEQYPYVLYTSDNINECLEYLKTILDAKKYNL